MTGPVRRAPLATGPCHGTGARRPPDPAWAGSRHHRTGPHPDSEPRPVTGPHRAKPPPRAAGPRQVTGPTPRAGPRRTTPPLVTGQHQASGRRPASGCHRAAGPSDPRAASAADPVHRAGAAVRWPRPSAAHRPQRLSGDLRQAAPAHRRPAHRHGPAGRPARPRRRRLPGRPQAPGHRGLGAGPQAAVRRRDQRHRGRARQLQGQDAAAQVALPGAGRRPGRGLGAAVQGDRHRRLRSRDGPVGHLAGQHRA